VPSDERNIQGWLWLWKICNNGDGCVLRPVNDKKDVRRDKQRGFGVTSTCRTGKIPGTVNKAQ
jgi:hypothetical protein